MPALKLSNVKLLESSIATKELNARLKKLSTVLSDMSQVRGDCGHGRASAPAEAHHAARDAMAHARLRGGVRAELPRPSRKACEGANLVARRRES